MNRRAFVIGTAAGAAVLVSSPARSSDLPQFRGRARQFIHIKSPPAAPEATFFDADGRIFALPRWRGQVVVLNLWATWCEACVWELPHLDRLAGRLGGDGLAVVTVSLDEEGLAAHPKARAFFKRLAVTRLPLLYDHARQVQDAYAAYGLQNRHGLPMTYVIDRAGRLRGYLPGAAEWDSFEAVQFLRQFMDES